MTVITTFIDPVFGKSAYLNTDGIGEAIGAPVRSIATVADLIAEPTAKIGSYYQIGDNTFKIVSAASYTASPTVIDLTGIAGQAVSTSLLQDCAFYEDTRSLAFMQSIYGGSDVVAVQYAGFWSSWDRANTVGTDKITTAGGLNLAPLADSSGYNVKAFGARGNWNNTLSTGNDDKIAFEKACRVAGRSSTSGGRVIVPLPDEGKEYYIGSSFDIGATGMVEIHGPNPEAMIIRKSGDDYCFTSQTSVFCGIFGLGISGQGNDDPSTNTTNEFYPAVKVGKEFRCNITLMRCGGDQYPGVTQFTKNGAGSKCFAFGCITDNSSTNRSNINIRVTRSAGDAFYAANIAGVRNTNGMIVLIRGSFQNTGYACNIEQGVRNEVTIMSVQGGFHAGIARIADTGNEINVLYSEFDVNVGFVFDGGANIATLLYDPGIATLVVLNNSNNRYIVHGPTPKDYRGNTPITYSGQAPVYSSGIKLGAGTTALSEYKAEAGDGTVAGLSNGSGSPLSATYTVQTLKYTRVGNSVNASVRIYGTLTANQTSSLYLENFGTLVGISMTAGTILGFGHIRNVTDGALSKPMIAKALNSNDISIKKHLEGTNAAMSNFALNGQSFELDLMLAFSL